jgi:putative transposase
MFSRNERLAMIERTHSRLPLKSQAQLLSLSRSSLYYQPKPPSAQEVQAKRRIDEIYTAHPFLGSRKITVLLRHEMRISRPTVQRYMCEMGITAIYPAPRLSQPRPEHKIYPYLLRNLLIECPDQVWGLDVTFIRLRGGWLYLVAVLDWFSRFVISWELSQSLEIDFVLSAIDRALLQAAPEICNTDQGSQFTSPRFTEKLLAAGAQISMDGRGRVVDNIFTERLWRSVKYEEVYLHDYGSPREAHQSLGRYFTFYNFDRPHQALDYRTPADRYYQDRSMPSNLIRRKEESTLF